MKRLSGSMSAELEEVIKKWFRRSGDRIRSVTKQNNRISINNKM